MAELAELGDVAAEEERHRPVDDDADFRWRSGSWYRWYERVTHQPRKPCRFRPSTSAMPLCRPRVATWPSMR
jgi:hypothetical protein